MPVPVPPSPKVQFELLGIGTEVPVKLTGSLTQAAVGPVKLVVIPPITIGLLRKVSWQPAELNVINVTIYVPFVRYVCDGLVAVEVLPSPKSHK